MSDFDLFLNLLEIHKEEDIPMIELILCAIEQGYLPKIDMKQEIEEA